MMRHKLDQEAFEAILLSVVERLNSSAKQGAFGSALQFETAVANELRTEERLSGLDIDYTPGTQRFPDVIVGGTFGVEAKYKAVGKAGDKWREVANSVFEGSRESGVEHVYVVFCKMAGTPEVRLKEYGQAIYHVRTSHVPRFAIDMDSEATPLFGSLGGIELSYAEFRNLSDREKMAHVKAYSRRKHPNDWLWWIDDDEEVLRAGELVIRNYTKLSKSEKRRLSAEALVLCPECMSGGLGGQNSRKTQVYARVGSYWLRAHSVYSGNVRDALSAGSMVDPCEDGNRMRCLVRHSVPFIQVALRELTDEVIEEYWGRKVPTGERRNYWLTLADRCALGWTPSAELDWSVEA